MPHQYIDWTVPEGDWCEASARGFWWIIATGVGSVFALILICVFLDWLSKRESVGNSASKSSDTRSNDSNL